MLRISAQKVDYFSKFILIPSSLFVFRIRGFFGWIIWFKRMIARIIRQIAARRRRYAASLHALEQYRASTRCALNSLPQWEHRRGDLRNPSTNASRHLWQTDV